MGTETGTPTPQHGTASGVLDGALAWLTDHAPWFGTRWDEHFPPRDFAGATVLELLMLCRLLRRGGPGAAHPGAARLERAAVAAALDVLPEAGDAPGPAGPAHRLWLLALLADLGRPTGTVTALAERHPPAVPGPGTSPVHALELRHVLGLAGLPAPPELPGTEPLYDACVAEHAGRTGEYDAYGVTHTVLYATDFGARPLPGDASRMARVLTGLLRAYLDEGHLDLAAELLLCARIAGGADPGLERRGWEELAAAQRPDGSLPGPPFDAAVLAGRAGERATAYVFRTCYHTTLVTAMAAARAGAPAARP
ncbi:MULTISPECIES: hypothetical protein [unclassified Nocardiopsis]|uniref:DUF6895 family protein n=1 Tax=unclassified Nocardiopsis TaxID=2649073 RepID=UPI00135A9234|nr:MULTISPECIES: hypothetical protein [unclassified Nocardiopsis]